MLVPAQPAYVYEEAAAKADAADKGGNAAKVRSKVARFIHVQSGVKLCGFDSCLDYSVFRRSAQKYD